MIYIYILTFFPVHLSSHPSNQCFKDYTTKKTVDKFRKKKVKRRNMYL